MLLLGLICGSAFKKKILLELTQTNIEFLLIKQLPQLPINVGN